METTPISLRLEERFVRAVKEYADELRRRGDHPYTFRSLANDFRALILSHPDAGKLADKKNDGR